MKTDRDVNRPTAPRPEPMRTHTVRTGSEWEEAEAVAKAEGMSGVSEVVRHYLREYVTGAAPDIKRKLGA